MLLLLLNATIEFICAIINALILVAPKLIDLYILLKNFVDLTSPLSLILIYIGVPLTSLCMLTSVIKYIYKYFSYKSFFYFNVNKT